MKALVPSDLAYIKRANEAAQRLSVTRSIAAVALAELHNTSAELLVRETWPSDASASVLTKAAVTPMMTTDSLPMLTSVRVMPSVAPDSAAMKLFSQAGLKLDFTGTHQFSIPHLGSFPSPIWVAEGAAIPVIAAALDSTTVGPTKKLAFIVPVSGHLANYSIPAATDIFRTLMADSAGAMLDSAVFSDVPGDATRVGGILADADPITATAGGGTAALLGDLKNLVGEISASGVNTANVILVMHPQQRESLAVLAPQYPRTVLETAALPVGSVVAVNVDAVVTGYDGSATIYTSKSADLHFEDTTPLPISTAGTPPTIAVPVRSSFQHDLITLKLICRCAWAVRPGAVAYTTGATW